MAVVAVFADSAFLYALLDRHDWSIVPRSNAFGRSCSAQRPLICTDYVVAEALALAKSRAGSLRVASPCGSELRIDRLDGIDWRSAGGSDSPRRSLLRKHADHEYSFTDCTSFVVMRELTIRDALTIDAHFVEAGFRALLRAG